MEHTGGHRIFVRGMESWSSELFTRPVGVHITPMNHGRVYGKYTELLDGGYKPTFTSLNGTTLQIRSVNKNLCRTFHSAVTVEEFQDQVFWCLGESSS